MRSLESFSLSFSTQLSNFSPIRPFGPMQSFTRSATRHPVKNTVFGAVETQEPISTVGELGDPMQASRPSGTPSWSENHPMSVSREAVRSFGGWTELVRSTWIAGSVSWLGNATGSSWEMEEPG